MTPEPGRAELRLQLARLEAENARLRALIEDLRADRVAFHEFARQEAKRC